jgi:hypothetical protein
VPSSIILKKMSNPATSSGIRDNHRRGTVADLLKAKIQPGSRLSVVSAFFKIYAYETLEANRKLLEDAPLGFYAGRLRPPSPPPGERARVRAIDIFNE